MDVQHIRLYVHSIINSVPASFFSHLDVMKQPDERATFRRFNGHYLYGAIILCFTMVYGLFFLVWESEPSSGWLPDLTTNRYQFLHQIMLRSMWKAIDYTLYCSATQVVIDLLLLYCKSPIPTKCLISSEKNKKKEYQLLVRYRDGLKHTLQYAFLPFGLLLLAYMYLNVYLNGTFRLSLASVLFWSILFPQTVMSVYYCLCILPVYLILTSAYVRIQQRSLCEQLAELNRKFGAMKRTTNYRKYWRSFLRLNGGYRTVCRDLAAYASFWADLLTLTLATIIVLECYLLYAFLYLGLDASELVSRVIYTSMFIDLNLIQMMLVHQCAQVATMNGRWLKQNRQFLLLLLKRESVNAIHLLKVERLHEPQSLRECSFRMTGNKRITSKTFFMILSYISTLFMYVCKSL